ncbi:MAG: MBL fold metallo-hydrolase [Burkholderiales bacterium]|jgi:glyoxylase-like metal-dependent hydrolase (beta-lactamase superfamily II)|nr:MBL fold metallo-hydrolase [Burkholderiales bacterium]
MIRFQRLFQLSVLSGAIALGGGALLTAAPAARAAAPQVRTQAPGFYRAVLGDFEITALSDGTVDLDVPKLLHEPAAKTNAALARDFVKAPLETSVNAFLVNTGTKLVLIDAGSGSLFGPTLGKLADSIKAAGYRPDQVDDIFITHFHPDHVGGLSADGQRVFPNATLHADKAESDFWLSQANLDKAPADMKGFFQGAMGSVNPYVAAGRYQPFEGDGEPVPGIHTHATHGHTAGHTSYVVESKGQRLVVIGDLIHVAAVQLPDPGVTIGFDSDAKAAAAARDAVFRQAARDGSMVAAAHLQFPGLGHLRAAGKAWQWVPVNYTTELK